MVSTVPSSALAPAIPNEVRLEKAVLRNDPVPLAAAAVSPAGPGVKAFWALAAEAAVPGAALDSGAVPGAAPGRAAVSAPPGAAPGVAVASAAGDWPAVAVALRRSSISSTTAALPAAVCRYRISSGKRSAGSRLGRARLPGRWVVNFCGCRDSVTGPEVRSASPIVPRRPTGGTQCPCRPLSGSSTECDDRAKSGYRVIVR